jgi:hypothetical protein
VAGIATAAALLMVTMGARQSLGLLVSPINSSTGLGIVTISFALAVRQFIWAATQPIARRSPIAMDPGGCWRSGSLC